MVNCNLFFLLKITDMHELIFYFFFYESLKLLTSRFISVFKCVSKLLIRRGAAARRPENMMAINASVFCCWSMPGNNNINNNKNNWFYPIEGNDMKRCFHVWLKTNKKRKWMSEIKGKKKKKHEPIKKDTSEARMTRYRISIWVCGGEEEKGDVVSLWYPAERSPSPAVLANLFPRSYLAPSQSPFSIINQITPTKLSFSCLIEIVFPLFLFFSPPLSSSTFFSSVSRACLFMFPLAAGSGFAGKEWKAEDLSFRNSGIRLMI